MTDVTVVGAGAIGLSIARRVLDQGGSVVVVDADTSGGRGSRAAAGVAIPSSRLLADPLMYGLAHAGAERLKVDLTTLEANNPLTRGKGVLRLLESAAQRAAVEESSANAGVSLGRWVDVDEAVYLEPALRGAKMVGAFVSDAGYLVDTDVYLDAMLRDLHLRGAEVALGERVLEVRAGGIVCTDSRVLRSDQLVIAAGAWSGRIPGLRGLPISAMRGQMLTMHLPGISLDRVLSGRAYLAPWRGSDIVLGATEDSAGFGEHVTIEGLAYLGAALMRMAPRLVGARITRTWAGLRSVTQSGRPLLGRLRDAPSVLIASGHGGQGILSAAITGDIVSGLLAGVPHPLGDPFTPEEHGSAT